MTEQVTFEGESYVPLASAMRRLALTESEVRYLIAHGRLRHRSVGEALYVLQHDLEILAQKDPETLAKLLPPVNPKTMAARLPRL